MLILSQSVKDGPFHITIEPSGEYIQIDVLSVRGQQARIGITMPDNVTVLRDKLYQGNENGGNKL